MIIHYLKIAFRNLLKYKTQTVISILGLAVGLVTFSLSCIWLNYEKAYDTHWADADRIYQIGRWKENDVDKFGRYTSFLLAGYIKEKFPEIQASCAFYHAQTKEMGKDVYLLKTDSAYAQMFPLTILKGNDQFLYDNRLAGITESAAMRLFGTTDVLEKTLSSDLRRRGTGGEYTICALLEDGESHTNYPYDIITSSKDVEQSWGYGIAYTMVKLYPGTDVDKLNEKLKEHIREEDFKTPDGKVLKGLFNDAYKLVSLTALHHTYPSAPDAIRLEHIRLFNAVGLVVVACALLNYLILYIIRLHVRRREMALRRANGATTSSLLKMTMTEYLLLAGCAAFLGMVIAESLYRPFQKMAGINEEISFFYRESAIYMGMVMLVSLLLTAVTLHVQQRRSIRASLQPIASSGRFFSFRRLGIAAQLFVSILVLFCTMTLQKQLHHLHHSSDMGFTNMDVVIADGWLNWTDKEVDPVMEQLPYLEYYKTKNFPFDSRSFHTGSYEIQYEDEKGETHTIKIKRHHISADAYRVFGMQTIAGSVPTDAVGENDIWVNESLVAKLGIPVSEAIGKQLHSNFLQNGAVIPGKKPSSIIRGVIKDLQLSPIVPSTPTVYLLTRETTIGYGDNTNRMRFFTTSIKDVDEVEDSVLAHLKRSFPDMADKYMSLGFYTVRQQIEKALQSERMLMKLLGIASGICVLITLFGIFSMVNLSCERRRKEIALRKIHGANIKDIVALFVKEYGILLALSAAIAFLVGYAVMNIWLQYYVIQTSIPWWIYASILTSIILLIALCVGYRIWKAANENPADVVKSE